MITRYPYEDLGKADYGWLKARHHFSFGAYQNPARMGFGDLVVINDDLIAPHSGFDPHPHRNMEIITYVRRGAITHEDSLGNQGRTAAGDVQVMSAGTGIRHAEFNREDVETSLYQIWIKPRESGVAPRWDSRRFPASPVNETLPLLVSGYEEDLKGEKNILFIHANARIYGGRLAEGQEITQPLAQPAYLLVSEGKITVDDNTEITKGDGATFRPEGHNKLTLRATTPAEILLIALEPAAAMTGAKTSN